MRDIGYRADILNIATGRENARCSDESRLIIHLPLKQGRRHIDLIRALDKVTLDPQALLHQPLIRWEVHIREYYLCPLTIVKRAGNGTEGCRDASRKRYLMQLCTNHGRKFFAGRSNFAQPAFRPRVRTPLVPCLQKALDSLCGPL